MWETLRSRRRRVALVLALVVLATCDADPIARDQLLRGPSSTTSAPSSTSTAQAPTSAPPTSAMPGVISEEEASPPTSSAPRSSTTRRPLRPPAAAPTTAAPPPPPAPAKRPDAPNAGPNSAHTNVFWYDCDSLLEITDAELDEWKKRGVGGFSCSSAHLQGLGGTQDYTGDPAHPLSGEAYEQQRRIRSTAIVSRLHARGMKAYFGFYVANYQVPAAPFGDWFADGEWAEVVVPKLRDVAAMAKLEGFDGLSIDQEDYPGDGGRRHSWMWKYPGNTRPEAEVREKVRSRGAEVIQALLSGFPGAALNVYHWNFPGSWQELMKHEVGKRSANNAGETVFLEFWDGMTSVDGYGRVSFVDAVFYKSTHLSAPWHNALQHNTNALFATFSRGFRNWDYAADRVRVLPFAWSDHNPEEWPNRAQTKEEVQAQLEAFRVWGMAGEFFNFAFTPLSKYDYTPYVPAMQAAATAGTVDSEPPALSATPLAATGSGPTLTLQGSATDNLAIRSVRWQTDRGKSGQARLTWVVESGNYREGYRWRMDWVAEGVPNDPAVRSVTLVATDVKGLEVTHTLRF